MSLAPRVAVVVATYRRAALLPRLVAALEAQRDVGEIEVVIVDDSSDDDTAGVLQQLAAATPLRLLPLTQSHNQGPAAARNRGWRATTADVVAFTDDDCVPQPGWLAALLGEIDGVDADGVDREGADVVQGRTAPDPQQVRAHGPFSRTLDVPVMDGFFQTCNIAYRRHWLERLDGFDEAFRHPMGEDTDLAWRALAAGARATFAADALVHHDVRPSSVWTQVADSARWESVVLVVRKHPELRERLHSRYFWKPAHAPVLLALLGLVAAAAPGPAWRRVAAAAAVLPYAKHRLQDAPLPNTGSRRRRLMLLPGAFAVDAAEVGVLAAASVRYRTLVL